MNHVFGLLLERKLRQGGNTKRCKTYICNQQLHQLPPHHWVCSSRVLWQSAAVSEKKLEVINPSQLQNHYVFVTTAHIDLLKINLQAYPCTAYFNLVFFFCWHWRGVWILFELETINDNTSNVRNVLFFLHCSGHYVFLLWPGHYQLVIMASLWNDIQYVR